MLQRIITNRRVVVVHMEHRDLLPHGAVRNRLGPLHQHMGIVRLQCIVFLHSGLLDPVAVVEERLVRAVCERKHILVDRLPRLIAESLRFA